jgi:hypothetical protein
MTIIAVRSTKYVRFSGTNCGAGVRECDFWGSDPTACCNRYREGLEKARPQLELIAGGSAYARCRQCLEEFKPKERR